MAHYLRPEGTSFLAYLEQFKETGENRRFLNTYLLGILSAYLPMDRDHWLAALEGVFKRAKEENRRVFQSGADAGAAELGTRAGAND